MGLDYITINNQKYLFITPNKIYTDSILLARKVIASDFQPEGIIGVMRGGAVPGLVLPEVFRLYGSKIPFDFIYSIGYDGQQATGEAELHGLDRLDVAGKKILIGEDLWDTGNTLITIISKLASLGATEIRSAVLYFKPGNNKFPDLRPDYHLEDVDADRWIVLPHEINDIPPEARKFHPLYPYFNLE